MTSTSPLVSVVIPVYNQTAFLAHAIRSVLDQTYSHFEIIVVDDASPDDPWAVVSTFTDPRIRFIRHDHNRHLAASRNTGIRASRGEIIAFLDADDYFHPEKLARHVEYLEAHPQIGVTYNSRFELHYNSDSDIRTIYPSPPSVDLGDLVLGFPFSPSDMVVRKEWMLRVDLFDEAYRHFSEDLDINCRLALAGCRFARVNGVLNYRRYHSGRYLDVANRLGAALYTLERVFADPRCPERVRALRDIAFANNYLVWAYIAFKQGEIDLAQAYIRMAVARDPTLIRQEANGSCRLLDFLVHYSAFDRCQSHADILRRIVWQFPVELLDLTAQYKWAVARGHLLKAIWMLTWGFDEEGEEHLVQAQEMQVQADKGLLRKIVDEILHYQEAFGPRAAERVLAHLCSHLRPVLGLKAIRWLQGLYLINNAFAKYQEQNYRSVPIYVLRAIVSQPELLGNRGVLAILMRSVTALSFSGYS